METQYSVRSVLTLPWGAAVPGVVGIVEHLHEPLRNPGWSLQNGKLRDEQSGAVIEFMLSKHNSYWNPSEVVGQRVQIVGAMIWKEQKAKPNVNQGRPFAKLEIPAGVQVTWLDKEDTLFTRLTPPPAPAAIPPPIVAPTPSVRPAPGDIHRELRQLIALKALAAHEAGKSPLVPENERQSWAQDVYQAASRQSLHRQIDPEAVIYELNPDAAKLARPRLALLGELFAGREAALTRLLRGSGKLTMEQSWKDLSEEQAAEALADTELQGFFAKSA